MGCGLEMGGTSAQVRCLLVQLHDVPHLDQTGRVAEDGIDARFTAHTLNGDNTVQSAWGDQQHDNYTQ